MQTVPEEGAKPKARKLVSSRVVGDLRGIPEGRLNKWRCTGEGPPFYKLGKSVRYDLDEVDIWLEGQRRSSTSEHDVRVDAGTPRPKPPAP
jgi:hypothetical protein